MSTLPSWRELAIGGIVLEPGSTVNVRTGTWRTKKPVINQDACTRCRICWAYCPEGIIQELNKPYVTKKGHKYGVTYEVNYEYCKGCGICANECPVKAIDMVSEYE
ncbi:MAG: 4Fe-4S binding protein [Thermocladium sp.]|jgi:pyruvate ferredoxin oxidoreductase, delta subunit (EC 1.2.7.1)|nr:MAG: pyruvate ferredoxin oxidoreductase [Thermocladium sp. ECH_B]